MTVYGLRASSQCNFSEASAYHQVEPVTPQRPRYVSYNATTGLEIVSISNLCLEHE